MTKVEIAWMLSCLFLSLRMDILSRRLDRLQKLQEEDANRTLKALESLVHIVCED